MQLRVARHNADQTHKTSDGGLNGAVSRLSRRPIKPLRLSRLLGNPQ